jgi:serine-type D-Ala-D-Ala carboxypeptidase/endopeptidase (penicillin-binding protein 4)
MKNGQHLRALGLAFLFVTLTIPLLGQQRQAQVPSEGDSAEVATAALPSLQERAQRLAASTGGEWGIYAWSIDRGEPLIAVNERTPLIPASNNKVPTAIWALDELGPDHRFHTDLLVTGPIENGVLRGHVVLRGSGNPSFGYPPRTGFSMFVEDPMTPLRNMAQQLAARGVRTVEGGVIGDATAFDTIQVGPSWPTDTGGGAAQYAPRVSGLAFQRNMIWVEAHPTPGGIEIRTNPPTDVVPVVSRVSVGGGRAMAVRRAAEDTVRLSGTISPRLLNRYGIGVRDPALMAADALRHALLEAGIQVQGTATTGATPEGSTLVHQHVSIPLELMIPLLNRDSDNFFAEHLWKAAAHSALGEGSYIRGGPASALHFMHHAGVTAGEFYQFDGSGLSSLSRMSANSLVQMLVYAHQQPYSESFHRSMAIAADRDGSMNRLFNNTPAAGNLHAKTGYIRNVRTLSGYVTARNGELIAFSFLFNGANTSGARGVQESLGVLLAEYDGRQGG